MRLVDRMRQQPAVVEPPLRLIFDLSDLVCHFGHHPYVTGIQRVQSSVVLALLRGALAVGQSAVFVSLTDRSGGWEEIPAQELERLLVDFGQPPAQRVVQYDLAEARAGVLPGMLPFDCDGVLGEGIPSVLCLLGAPWAHRTYVSRIVALKRRFGLRFVMMVHDLIPIYAPQTCERATTSLFDDFMRRAVRHADHCLAVSEHTARDLARYIESLSLPLPPISVTRNGSSFDEFLPLSARRLPAAALPARFVLFVATIEGRKNHLLMLDVWRRMLAEGKDPPHLVCVGRVGWRAERFLAGLAESGFVDGRVVLMENVSDVALLQLYAQCLFTVYPSAYEGWGLPVGEALAAGKMCVCSRLTALPEVAGIWGTPVDIDDADAVHAVICGLIADDAGRLERETVIRDTYRRTTWTEVAASVTAACGQAARTAWTEPSPDAAVSYSAEITFGESSDETGLPAGPDLLTRLSAARSGRLLSKPIRESDLLLGEDIRYEGAWGQPEHWGTWLCRGSGALVLAVAPHDDAVCIVALQVRAIPVAGPLPLQLEYDGRVVWGGTVGEQTRTILLNLSRPRDADRAGWWRLRLGIRLDPGPETLAIVSATDPRVPLLGLERLVVVPSSDVMTRLDLLTNLVGA